MEWFLTVKAKFAIWLMGVLRMDNEELKQKLQAFLDADRAFFESQFVTDERVALVSV